MSKRSPCLFIDANYLCYRAYFSKPKMDKDELPTEVLYGFFWDLVNLSRQFYTRKIAFCFDSKTNDRKLILPTYKSSRKEGLSEEEVEGRKKLYQQIDLLRREYLPRLGFKNVFVQKGKEADDILAVLPEVLKSDEHGIIVSNDHDLYQILSGRVSIWKPTTKKLYGIEDFREEWGLDPAMWNIVKGLAGCKTDDIPGVEGVGEKTAAKWLKGELKESSKTYRKITDAAGLARRNSDLVTLPMKGTRNVKVFRNKCTLAKWGEVMSELGMDTLIETPPWNFR